MRIPGKGQADTEHTEYVWPFPGMQVYIYFCGTTSATCAGEGRPMGGMAVGGNGLEMMLGLLYSLGDGPPGGEETIKMTHPGDRHVVGHRPHAGQNLLGAGQQKG